jgi:thioesterase domain-containing protein
LADVSGREVSTERDNGWSAELGQQTVLQEISGDHFTMMLQTGAAQLAAEIVSIVSQRVAATAHGGPRIG